MPTVNVEEENGNVDEGNGTFVAMSNKGKKKTIFHNGYMYRFDREQNGREYFFCEQ